MKFLVKRRKWFFSHFHHWFSPKRKAWSRGNRYYWLFKEFSAPSKKSENIQKWTGKDCSTGETYPCRRKGSVSIHHISSQWFSRNRFGKGLFGPTSWRTNCCQSQQKILARSAFLHQICRMTRTARFFPCHGICIIFTAVFRNFIGEGIVHSIANELTKVYCGKLIIRRELRFLCITNVHTLYTHTLLSGCLAKSETA